MLQKLNNATVDIHYVVDSQFWRRDIGNILDNVLNGVEYDSALVKSSKEFSDVNPINAREMAFSHFSSIVDVLYEGLGIVYSTDCQARIDLQKYFDSNNAVELSGSDSNRKFKVSDDIFNGIEIYMVIDNSIEKSKDKKTSSGSLPKCRATRAVRWM